MSTLGCCIGNGKTLSSKTFSLLKSQGGSARCAPSSKYKMASSTLLRSSPGACLMSLQSPIAEVQTQPLSFAPCCQRTTFALRSSLLGTWHSASRHNSVARFGPKTSSRINAWFKFGSNGMDSNSAGIYGSQGRDDFDEDDVEQARISHHVSALQKMCKKVTYYEQLMEASCDHGNRWYCSRNSAALPESALQF